MNAELAKSYCSRARLRENFQAVVPVSIPRTQTRNWDDLQSSMAIRARVTLERMLMQLWKTYILNPHKSFKMAD